MASRLDPNDPRPIRVQIADALRAAFQPGQKLATVAELAEEWDVAKETARAALKELQSERLVVTWQGRGTFYVTDKPADDTDPEIFLNRLEKIMTHVESLEIRVANLEKSQGLRHDR